MSTNPLKLKIAYLYPDILQSFCDEANVNAFCKRANWRDIETSVTLIQANDKVQSSKYDFYYIGGNNPDSLDYALKFLKQNDDELKIAAISGVPMLAVNCGYQLFGNYYQLLDKAQAQGLGIFDIHSRVSSNLHCGNILGSCSFLKNKVAGFVNYNIFSYYDSNPMPFLNLQKGQGNNDNDKTEGAKFSNVIGTHIQGALLAQNPHLCDHFISTALKVKYRCKIPLTPLCDDLEWYSYRYLVDGKSYLK